MTHASQDVRTQLAILADAGERQGTLEMLLGERAAIGVVGHPAGHVGECGSGAERQQPAIVDGATEQAWRQLGPEVMDDGSIQVATTDLAIRRAKGVHGLRVDAHPIAHAIRDRYEHAGGQAWRRLAVYRRIQQSCRTLKRSYFPRRLPPTRSTPTTDATLLIGGSYNPLNRNLDCSGEPTQRIRVRDPPRPLNLADPLLGGAGLSALGLGGVVDASNHISLRQAQVVTLFHHKPAER
jgi:hypothetical protein